jgi:hypothetical protein
MEETIRNLATDLFADVFDRLFTPFIRACVTDRARQREIGRRVAEVSDAAGQGTARHLILNWPAPRAEELSECFAVLGDAIAEISPNDIWPPGGSAEARASELAARASLSRWSKAQSARFGIALESLVASLWQAGDVFYHWKETGFSASYEPLQGLVRQLKALAANAAVHARPNVAADERFGWIYRERLLELSARVEAGTLRAVSVSTIGLDDLFIVPTVMRRQLEPALRNNGSHELLQTDVAQPYTDVTDDLPVQWTPDSPARADEALFDIGHRVKVLIGRPGSGKSTLLLWMQRQVAWGYRPYVLADEQAIPLLLRVRELRGLTQDQLRENRRLLELAMGSAYQAVLMPDGWLNRQFTAGRVLLLLDGLDETEASFRDDVLLPWLVSLLTQHPGCHAVITSRPAGFPESMFAPTGPFGTWGVVDYALQDFDADAIREYLRHWFTQIRLAKNESSADATRGGGVDATTVYSSLTRSPPVAELARIPLLLSAICLVYHFEGGRLPDDRAVLYGLCVEGLLDRWDAQKGLRSQFTVADKLLFCRELAAAMTVDGLRECQIAKAREIARTALTEIPQADLLVEHIRDRAGLVIEHTSGKLSFAHLTFQEYLTAVAVRDENRQRVTIQTLAENHTDQRWREVIFLFCRLAPPALTRQLLDVIRNTQPPSEQSGIRIYRQLAANRNSIRLQLSAFYSCPQSITTDSHYRATFIGDLLGIPIIEPTHFISQYGLDELMRVQLPDVDISNAIRSGCALRVRHDVYPLGITWGGMWLFQHPTESVELPNLTGLLQNWREQRAGDLRQAVWHYYAFSSLEELAANGIRSELWQAPLSDVLEHRGRFQAEAALMGISSRLLLQSGRFLNRRHSDWNMFNYVPESLLIELLECFSNSQWPKASDISSIFMALVSGSKSQPSSSTVRDRFVMVCQTIANRLEQMSGGSDLRTWVAFLQSTA